MKRPMIISLGIMVVVTVVSVLYLFDVTETVRSICKI